MNALRNKVMLIGHVGADPEVQEFENGRKRARFSLATNEVYRNQQGEKVTDTHWHQLVAWGKTASLTAQLLQKGQEVAIEGKLITRSYEKDGSKRYVTEVVVNDLLLLGSTSKQAS